MARPESFQAPPREDIGIHEVASWILRLGVVASVLVMALGLVISLRAHPDIARMQGLRFSTNFREILEGTAALNGAAIMELGILILVLTPIMRVASSMALFAVKERDWLYTVVTFLVLALTLLSLLILR